MSLDPTSVPAKWHANPSNGLSRGTNVTDDRQTDRPRYGEMCSNRRNRLSCKMRLRLKSVPQFLGLTGEFVERSGSAQLTPDQNDSDTRERIFVQFSLDVIHTECE